MKRTLNLTLFACLMLATISTVDAAQTKDKSIPQSFGTGKKVVKSTSQGWGIKAKVITALGVVATGIGLYVAWKKYTATDKDLEILKQFEKNQENVGKYQIPAGRAGRLMHHVLALYEPCQEAMRNPESQANIEALFNNEEFIGLINHERFGYICEAQINAFFNGQIFVQTHAHPNFVQGTLNMLRASIRQSNQQPEPNV
jgi:hypothetical protein